MTDWSALSHAHGSAENIPGLLDRVATTNDQDAWSELWGALCHQGSTYPASYAALPHLAAIDDVQAVVLAGGIVADGGDEVRAEHAAAISTLLARANELLPGADEETYAYLVESVLTFEGLVDSVDALAWGVADEEYEIECPECGTATLILVAEGVSRADDHPDRPLRPADPAQLTGIGRRVYETAANHGKKKVARVFLHAFGQATCPACGIEVTVADLLS
ncbi:hypothetical protein LFM09_05605 [Lentzea alba]|uniref:hypothetical protein n=1 Tax=Lentzea alba TaxID=2714351 RepID=UPI0039BFB3FC